MMKYERLTERKGYSIGIYVDKDFINKGQWQNVRELVNNTRISNIENVFDRLAELEDKMENGTLIELKDRKPLMWGKDGDTVHCQHCGEDLMGVFYGETEIIQCPKCGGFVDGLIAEGYNEAKLKELQNG